MNNEQNAFFFEVPQIPRNEVPSANLFRTENSILFDELKKRKLFFSCFQVDHRYYLFFYAEKSIPIDFLYQSFEDMSSNLDKSTK